MNTPESLDRQPVVPEGLDPRDKEAFQAARIILVNYIREMIQEARRRYSPADIGFKQELDFRFSAFKSSRTEQGHTVSSFNQMTGHDQDAWRQVIEDACFAEGVDASQIPESWLKQMEQ